MKSGKLFVVWLSLLGTIFFSATEVISESKSTREKHSIKLSLGYDLGTLSYKLKLDNPIFVQADINPFFLAASGIIGCQVYNDPTNEVYIGLGVGASLIGVIYFYPGVGYRFSINEQHSAFLESALGFYNILFFGDYGLEKDILPIIRVGYQLSL